MNLLLKANYLSLLCTAVSTRGFCISSLNMACIETFTSNESTDLNAIIEKMNNLQGDITGINVRIDASTLSVRHGVDEMHSRIMD